MMAEDFRIILNRRPFKPFRMYISNGEHFDVRHPEMATVSASTVSFEIGPHITPQIGWYNLIHIVKIVELNGGRKRQRRQKRTA